MIPAQFDYHAPTTVDEAVTLLSQAGDDVKVLAGGQSLIPVLRLRMAAPDVLVDLGRVDELSGVRDDGDAIVIGAMTSHHTVANDPLVAENARLITEAVRTVADPQVRHRGTFGGALVHADPAGDLPATAVALGAEFGISGSDGRRTVAAEDFFVDLFTTAVGEDEILTHVRVPKHAGWGADYQKFTRVAQQWSIVGVAATVRMEGDTIAEARVGLTNMGSTPIRARAVETAVAGSSVDGIDAAAASAAEGTNPPTDLNGDADYRRHLASVLTARALRAAAGS
ncbi:MAG TPA: xanthine dehydrogenase family protein subunit M [Nocardioidaceae bacterium]|nr:xanthine dehydrogenase family protein subunit M [Nocardioidaceae bacterium]